MKFSELWLREWVNITFNIKELVRQMTMAGLQVDAMEPVANPCNGVIIGEIIDYTYDSINQLYITKVNIGNNRLLNIICYSSNCRRGVKVAVAISKTMLLSDHYTMQKTILYNDKFDGILYSFKDLGITNYCSDFIELPEDAPIGVDIREYLKLNDNIIEISITPNRADCFSIMGIARDIAVLNNIEVNTLNIIPVTSIISDTIPIKIETINACPRYLGRVIKDINIYALTPLWMKEKLRRSGIQSINVIIDITNYVMIELGQPIHVFDKDCIRGGIIVRMARDNEKLILIDEKEIVLNTNTLVISDYQQVLAIGGVCNGKYSSINDMTRNILLECAFFNPYIITNYIRYYNLHTESSCRYEHGVDPSLQHKAMEYVTCLLLKICGGKAGPVIDITNEDMLPKDIIIILYRKKLDRILGYYITNSQVNSILQRLGCKVIDYIDRWHVIAPSWRFDIKIEEDLIEEIARVYGYHNIPNKSVQINLKMNMHSENVLSLKRVKTMLNDKGYQEIITYSFVDPKLQQLIHPDKKALVISNPISNEMSVMRLSLWSGLLSTIIYNKNRQQNRIRIFETGLCFIPDIQANLGVHQNLMLAGAIYGNRYEDHWDIKKNTVDFYDMKGDIEAILDLTGKLSEIEFHTHSIPPALHFGQSASIYLHNKCFGFVGVLHPRLEYKLSLTHRTVIFELEWSKIANCIIPQIQKISRFPINRRDISIIVPEHISAGDVLAECRKINISQIISVNLLDVYRGHGITSGYKSFTISLILQDSHYTLQEKEISNIVSKCIEVLKYRLQASLRY